MGVYGNDGKYDTFKDIESEGQRAAELDAKVAAAYQEQVAKNKALLDNDSRMTGAVGRAVPRVIDKDNRIPYVPGERQASPFPPDIMKDENWNGRQQEALQHGVLQASYSQYTKEKVEGLERMAETRGFNTAVNAMFILMSQFFGPTHQAIQILNTLKGKYNHDNSGLSGKVSLDQNR